VPWARRTPVTATLPAIFGSSGVMTTLTPDVTTSVMLMVTALSGAPHLIANVTSLIQTIATEEPAEVTSVLSELASLLNLTASASGASGLPTLSTIFNGTELNLRDSTKYGSSHTSDTVGTSTLSSDLDDTADNFTDPYMQDDNLTFTDEQINISLSINFTDEGEGLFNFTDGHSEIISSYPTEYSDMTSNVTGLNTESTAFEVSETDLDTNSKNLSLEQYLDNISNNFTDDFVITESITPMNSVSVTNFTFDDDNKSHGLTSVMESEELTSIVITTLETLLAQNKDFVSTNRYLEHVSQMIQKTTTDVTDSTKCYSSQCNTLPTDDTASSSESSFAPDATSDKHSTAISTESTLTLEESDGTCSIKVTMYSCNKRMNSEKGTFRVNLTPYSRVLDNLIVAQLATRFPIRYGM
jgi:hypothetical protein